MKIHIYYIGGLIILLSVLLNSCRDASYPKEMEHAENILLSNPDSSLYILNKMKGRIKSEPKSTRMYYEILLCRAQDLCYVPHKSDDVMTVVNEYYKERNDKDKLFLSYYCLGCIYRDMGDAPAAMKSFQKALDLIGYCKDNAMKARVYTQMGNLQQITFSDREALKSFKQALKYFKLAKDSLAIPFSESDVAFAYYKLSQNKKAIEYCKLANNSTNQLVDRKRRANSKLGIVQVFLSIYDYDDAGKLFDELDRYSDCLKDNAPYFVGKGMVYAAKDINDSAIICYKRAVEIGNSNIKAEAYSYLYQTYKWLKNYPASFKYLELYNDISTENLTKSHHEEVTRLQALYNYQRTENKNKELDMENEQNRTVILWLVSVILIGVIAILLYRQRNIVMLQQKNRLIEELKKQQKVSSSAKTEDSWTRFRKSDIYGIFRNAVVNGELVYGSDQMNRYWTELTTTTDEIFENLSLKLTGICPTINDRERKLCMLTKLDLPFVTMAILLYTTPSNITNMRNRLSRKCRYADSNGKPFDDFIHDL